MDRLARNPVVDTNRFGFIAKKKCPTSCGRS